MSSNDTYVTGLFPDRASAERAYQHAHERGYDVKDVNMVMNDETRKKHFGATTETTELGNKAAEGAGIGGAIGGTVGAVAAAIAAIGTSLVLPGIGPRGRRPHRRGVRRGGARAPPVAASSARWSGGASRRSAWSTTRKASRRAASSWA